MKEDVEEKRNEQEEETEIQFLGGKWTQRYALWYIRVWQVFMSV